MTKHLQLMQKLQYSQVSNKFCRPRSQPKAMRTEAREVPFNPETQLISALIESHRMQLMSY